jgi:hypothetical protein
MFSATSFYSVGRFFVSPPHAGIGIMTNQTVITIVVQDFTNDGEFFNSGEAVIKQRAAKVSELRQSGGPVLSGSMTLRPRLAAGLPFRV